MPDNRWAVIGKSVPLEKERLSPRDLVLLFVVWIVSSLAVADIWASSPGGSTSGRGWPDSSLIGLIAVLAILPLCALLSTLTSGRRHLKQALLIFQGRGFLCLLLLIFGFGQILLLAPATRGLVTVQNLLVPIGLLIILWVFLGRSEIRRQTVILTACWLVAVALSGRTLGLMIEKFDLAAASWRTQALAMYLAGSLLLLALAPLALLSKPFYTGLEGFFARRARVAGWIFVSALVAATLVLGLNQLTDWEQIRLTLAAEILVFSLVLAIGWLSLQAPDGQEAPAVSPRSFSSRWLYGVAVVAILVTFLAVSERIPRADNPDSLAYRTIARSYAEGEWPIRGYWSPLLSWLMVPAVLSGAGPEIGYRWVVRATGLVWIILALLMARRMGLSRTSQVAVALITAVVALMSGIQAVTPDLLSAACVLLYLYVLSHPRVTESPVRFGLLSGLAGGLAYYAKYYNFPFFVVNFLVSGIVLWRSGAGRRKMLSALAAGLVAFFLVSIPWVVALGSRYGKLTITTSSGINRALVGQASEGHVCWSGRLCDHPADVLYPGEDPLPEYFAGYGWSPLDDLGSLRHQIRLIWSAVSTWGVAMLEGPSPFPPVGLFVFGLAPFVMWTDQEGGRRLGWLALTFATYAGGYLLTYGQDFRYYLPIVPVFWIGVYAIVEKYLPSLQRSLRLPPTAKRVPVLLLAIPLLSFSWFVPIRGLAQGQEGTCYRTDSERMADDLIPPIVGTDPDIHFVAYHTRMRTFGVIRPERPANEVAEALREMGVRTLLAGESTAMATDLPAEFGYTRVAEVSVCGVPYSILRAPDG